MKHVRPVSLSALFIALSLLLIIPVACTPGRGGGGGGADDDDDDDGRDPSHATGDSDAGSTQGTGSGNQTGDAVVGNTESYGAGDSILYVLNLSGLDVWEVYVTPCSSSSWGVDWLGDWFLPDDWYFVLTGLDADCYDLEAWDLDGDVWWEKWGAQIDGEYTFVLLPPAAGDDDDIVDDDDDASDCADDEVEDCVGGCSPIDWIADDYCDDSLNCAEFSWDGGDCVEGDDDDAADDDDATGCGGDEMLDCDGVCGPIAWLGDTYCDDNSYEYPEGSGITINYNCASLNYDEGDCAR
jgi:hypothetical protein